MLKLISLFLLVFLFPNVLALAGDRAGNGGGTGEKTLLFAYLKMPEYLRLCKTSSECTANDTERKLLTKIEQLLQAYPPSSNRIIFVSERLNPGSFFPDGKAHGVIRSAKTGDAPNSPIWINTDHLYRTFSEGMLEPIELPSAAAILLDELAHHVDIRYKDKSEHLKLDLLCTRLKMLLASVSQRTDSDAPVLPITATILNFPNLHTGAQLFLNNRLEMRNLSLLLHESVMKQARCNTPKGKITGFTLENLHWHLRQSKSDAWGYAAMPSDWKMDPQIYKLHAWLNVDCSEEDRTPKGTQNVYVEFIYGDYPFQDRIANLPLNYDWPDRAWIKVVFCDHKTKSSPLCH